MQAGPQPPETGILPRNSIIRRVNRERVLFLGSSCALLMQLAHPLVAAGVAAYSDFEHHPLRRFNRTVRLTLSMVFGTRREALEAAQQINRAHQPVTGTLQEDGGPVPRGTPYSAMDPALLLWVQATLVYTALTTYRTFVGPLTEDECDRYYQETVAIGTLLGIPPERRAPDWRGFQAYLWGMMATGPVAVGDGGRRLARSVLRPRIRGVPAAVFAPFQVITAGLLPEPLRRQYGLAWGAAERDTFRVCRALVPRLVAITPDRLRTVPQGRAAF